MSVDFINRSGPPASQIFLSATFDCWDSAGNHLVSAFPVLTLEFLRNGGVKLWYVMQTGANKTITQAGNYPCAFTVKTSDGDIAIFEQQIVILPTP